MSKHRSAHDVASVRNFAIIAHIDHGKSTLADRFIQLCGGLEAHQMSEQVLDSMDLERERGITIKAQAVTLNYQRDNKEYTLNLIDTPGHVDFGYEVSRSLSACEGVLLIVDAAQGVEAQSIANCYAAIEQGMCVIPVINKIDLPAADPEAVCHQIEDMIGIDTGDALYVSAKTGQGVSGLMDAIIERIPPPVGDADAPLRAMIVDSRFDNYVGVVSLVRIVDGQLEQGMKVRPMSTGHSGGRTCQVESLGVYTPASTPRDRLTIGEVGFVVAGIKDIQAARVGDTLTSEHHPADKPLPGFKTVTPRVFAGIFPVNADDRAGLREALDKLALNDASLVYEPESSSALGVGFRCGFLGLLHMEIIQERLEREYNLSLIVTAPTVTYKVRLTSGVEKNIHSPDDLPEPQKIAAIDEPLLNVSIVTPKEHVGAVMNLCMSKRGVRNSFRYSGRQAMMEFELPMSEVVFDFFDKLKSHTRGYASFDYEMSGYQTAPLIRLDVLINGDRVDALSCITHRSNAETIGRDLVERMKTLIPRQMFDIAIQAVIGSRVIARSTVKALRKNVTAKCYGGDVTRKRKLLEKQKAGKKRMKMLGNVEVPQEAFFAILKTDHAEKRA